MVQATGNKGMNTDLIPDWKLLKHHLIEDGIFLQWDPDNDVYLRSNLSRILRNTEGQQYLWCLWHKDEFTHDDPSTLVIIWLLLELTLKDSMKACL